MRASAHSGEIDGIPIVVVDEDIVAEARGIIGLKRIVVGRDFNGLPVDEQMAVLHHEAAHCAGYHLEIRIVLVLALLAALFTLVNWKIMAAAGLSLVGIFALQQVAHAQEYEADRFACRLGHGVGLKAFLRRAAKLPGDEFHPSPRARLRAIDRKESK